MNSDVQGNVNPEKPIEARAVGALIGNIYDRGTVKGADDRLYEIYPAALAPDRGDYLAYIVREFRPVSTVEIGLAWGLSTLFILGTLSENGHAEPHVVMDPFQWYGYHDAALRLLRDNGLERMVEFHREPSVFFLPKLAEQGRKFDFAFIDGDHSYEAVLCDFWLLDPLIKPGGVIVFDDIWAEGVDRVCGLTQLFGYAMHSEHLDPGFIYRPLMRTYVKTGKLGFRQQLEIEKLEWQFKKARATTILSIDGTLDFSNVGLRRRAAHDSAHDGLMALRKGERDLARLHFYRALRDRPLKLKTYMRLARTFLPLGLARALSGRRVHGEISEPNSETISLR
jgi:predicted O-methyltransferase YrrM